MLLLLITFVGLQILDVFCRSTDCLYQHHPQNGGTFWMGGMFGTGMALAPKNVVGDKDSGGGGGGTAGGELQEFMCTLCMHKLLLDNAIPLANSRNNEKDKFTISTISSSSGTNNSPGDGQQKQQGKSEMNGQRMEFVKRQWDNVKQADPKLARIFEKLRREYEQLVLSGEKLALGKLKKQIVLGVFVLADRMEIGSSELGIPPPKSAGSKKSNAQKEEQPLLPTLAKLWAQIDQNVWDEKSDDDEGNENSNKGEKKENFNGNKSEEKCWGKSERKNDRRGRILQLILRAMDDNVTSTNVIMKSETKNRRRRKKRDNMVPIVLIVALVLILMIAFAICYGCNPCGTKHHEHHEIFDGAKHHEIFGDAKHHEIFVKFRYGADTFDQNGNRRSDHVYIVIGDNEYDYTSDGARVRHKNWRKKFPTKTFSFNPVLKVQDDAKQAKTLLNGMASGNWGKGSLDSFRLCLDFAYQFVCRLNGDVCPPKRQWPNEFVHFDRRWVRARRNVERLSVFDERYRTSKQNCELGVTSSDPTAVVIEMPPTVNDNYSNTNTAHHQLATSNGGGTMPTPGLTKAETDGEYPWWYAYYYTESP